jgi:hypothetical protein
MPARVVRRRVLEVGDGDVGTGDELPEGAGIARPLRVRQIPPERRAVLAASSDVGFFSLLFFFNWVISYFTES